MAIGIYEDSVDSPAWNFDPKGIFLIKAAYKVGVMVNNRKKGKDTACSRANTANSTVKFDWKHIRGLKVPNQMKMFVWWLVHNSLASNMKIKKLAVELDARCPV